MIRKAILTALFSVSLFFQLLSQNCTTLGQTPGSSFPVCGSSTFDQVNVPICGSTTIPTPCAGPGIIYQNKNPFWYKFTCFSTGTLGFVITPTNLADDYDWQLFDITNRDPDDVFIDTSLFVACNWSGSNGITGTSAAGTSLIECGGFGVPLFSSMPTLIQGNTYILLVSHFTNSQIGYSLSFGGGTTVITDPATPKLQSATVTCDGKKIAVKLSKKMKCNSLATNGSDFTILGTTASITNAVGINCSTTFELDSLELTLSSPLTGGNYTISVKNGTDLNTLLDNCDIGVAVGDSVKFTFVATPPPSIDSITKPGCAPDEIQIVFDSQIMCNSLATDGSDFIISGPTVVSISGISSTCTSSTSIVKLKLTSPIFNQGLYTVKIKSGTDGNTVKKSCGVEAIIGDSAKFTAADSVSADFKFTINKSCAADTVKFIHLGNNAVNSWSWTFDNATTSILQNPTKILSFTNHTVKLIVSNGICKDTSIISLNLTAPPPITSILSQTNATCGLNNGTASVALSGGTGAISYLWTPGNYTTSSINNLVPGKYYFSAKDSLGCTKKDSIDVIGQPKLIISGKIITNVSCFGLKNGKVIPVVTGGLPPYTYTWTKGASIFSGTPLQNADTGKYFLTVTDSKGCTDTTSVIINQPQKLANNLIINATTCGKTNGSATVTISGGTSPYIYSWLPIGGSSSAASNLPEGNYSVKVTDSKGCLDSTNIIIASSNPLTSTIVTSKVTCIEDKNGTATVNPNGTPPYLFSWSPVGGNNAIATGLGIGNYSVVTTDNKGCKDTAVAVISGPLPLSQTIAAIGTSCGFNNGLATITQSGGTAPYNYNWTPFGGIAANATNLSAGTYTVFIADANGCKDTAILNIGNSTSITSSIATTDVSCAGGNNGTAVANHNGTAPFSYTWFPTGGTNKNASSLIAGNYSVIIKDNKGCIDTGFTIIKQPLTLQHSVSFVGTSCNKPNGSGTVVLSGGIGQYNYNWIPIGGNNALANNLPAGNYVIATSDKNGCKDTARISIAPSNPLTATATTSNVSCNGGNNGSATVQPIGSPPYSYLWNPIGITSQSATGLTNGIYVVYISDSKGCLDTLSIPILVENPLNVKITKQVDVVCNGGSNGSAIVSVTGVKPFTYLWSPNGGNDTIANNLSSGKYVVTVKDGKGCILKDSVLIKEPNAISNIIIYTKTTCNLNNAMASVKSTGGAGQYLYEWIPGNLTTSIVNNLAPGQYNLTVTDTVGCKKNEIITITAIPPPIINQIIKTDVLCKGESTGSANPIVINGTVPYSYQWKGINFLASGQFLNNVPIGNFILTITDSNNCKTSDTVSINEPAMLNVATFPNNTSCGLNNGLIAALGIGGTFPYKFNWSTGFTGDTVFNLSPGNYNVKIEDANGCSANSSIVKVNSSNKLSITLGNERNICPGVEITLTPGNFTKYKWQDGSDIPIYKAKLPGLYSVNVTDNKGCTAIAEVKINNQCDDIVFPTAFSPNDDKKNDEFGPLGTLLAINDYNLRIFSRWGQLIFSSNDPFKKWNGKNDALGTYVWIASYMFNGKPKTVQKGTILLIK